MGRDKRALLHETPCARLFVNQDSTEWKVLYTPDGKEENEKEIMFVPNYERDEVDVKYWELAQWR